MKSEDWGKKIEAIKRLIEMLNSGEAAEAQIAHLQYWIEGEPYPASALTLSPDYTPNLEQTESGLQCDAFFPEEMLTPHVRLEGQRIETGLIRVRLEVKIDDIVAIVVTTESGPQTTLYMMG
jgi:hypothetical protein